jgi:ubiquinone/menaquinone biosynthesis C-methylase UbiE
MSYRDIAAPITRRFRERRLRRLSQAFPPELCRTVLDVGGSPSIWEMIDYPSDITIINLDPVMLGGAVGNGRRRYTAVVGDARSLAYPDVSFDLVFSNSVIEHVGNYSDMEAFATEVRRVGKYYYCQTPNKWFPIEPHFGTLFLHWFPSILQKYFVFRYFTLAGLVNKPDRETVKVLLNDVKLLRLRDLKRLFPDARIERERFLLFTKSFVAMRSPQ